jgi:hypothetical protein
MDTISPTALKAIEFYGGSQLWQSAKKIEAEGQRFFSLWSKAFLLG